MARVPQGMHYSMPVKVVPKLQNLKQKHKNTTMLMSALVFSSFQEW
jgi:hypothetical protein